MGTLAKRLPGHCGRVPTWPLHVPNDPHGTHACVTFTDIRGANICASAPFPLCGKYLGMCVEYLSNIPVVRKQLHCNDGPKDTITMQFCNLNDDLSQTGDAIWSSCKVWMIIIQRHSTMYSVSATCCDQTVGHHQALQIVCHIKADTRKLPFRNWYLSFTVSYRVALQVWFDNLQLNLVT